VKSCESSAYLQETGARHAVEVSRLGRRTKRNLRSSGEGPTRDESIVLWWRNAREKTGKGGGSEAGQQTNL